jgi:hypothetical protein
MKRWFFRISSLRADDCFISEKLTCTLKVNGVTGHVNSIENDGVHWKHSGAFAPIVGSMLDVIAWLLFILFYALFWSRGFSLFQNVIVTIVSLAIAVLLIGLMWIIWGTHYHRSVVRWTMPS